MKNLRSLLLAAALLVSGVPGAAHSEPAEGGSGSVAVTAAVRGVHLAVLDDAGEISQIWSNAPGPDAAVVFRVGTPGGAEIPASEALDQQYQAITATIDWASGRGLVWQRAS